MDESEGSKAVRAAYSSLATSVVREVQQLQTQSVLAPTVAVDNATGVVTMEEKTASGEVLLGSLPAAQLRRACKCALCVDEFTGRQLLDPASVREDVRPTHVQTMGNYAVAVQWSDGHKSSIFAYASLSELMKK